MVISLSLLLLAAAPQVALLSTGPDAEVTELRFAPLAEPSVSALVARLSHASMEMTLRYAHLTPDVKNAAVQVLDAPACDMEAAHRRHMDPSGQQKGLQPLEITGL